MDKKDGVSCQEVVLILTLPTGSSWFGITMISASHLLPWLHVPKILFVCLFGILSVTHARQFLLFYLLVHRFFPLFLPFSVESITELLF